MLDQFASSCSLIGRYSAAVDTPSISKTNLNFYIFACHSHSTLVEMLAEQSGCKSNDLLKEYHAYVVAGACMKSWLHDRTIVAHVNLSSFLGVAVNVFGAICSVTNIQPLS